MIGIKNQERNERCNVIYSKICTQWITIKKLQICKSVHLVTVKLFSVDAARAFVGVRTVRIRPTRKRRRGQSSTR